MRRIAIRLLNIILPAILIAGTACSPLPNQNTAPTQQVTTPQSHVRKINTIPYISNRKPVIFVMGIANNTLKHVADQIIRTFNRDGAPIDIALPPLTNNENYNAYAYLRDFVDAGIINICLDGNTVIWLNSESGKNQTAIDTLSDNLTKYRQQLQQFFGTSTTACLIPESYYSETNYAAVNASSFKVITSSGIQDLTITNEPVSWQGNIKHNGLYKLPIAARLDYTLPEMENFESTDSLYTSLLSKADADVTSAIDQSISEEGIALIEISASSFLDSSGEIDPLRLAQLSMLITSIKEKYDITTEDDWYSYISRWAETATNTGNRIMPKYNGGPAIIFRLDDVSKGWHEDVVKELLLLFEKNNIPIDLGIVSNVAGTDSYAMPWLIDYVNKGVAGISVHGYDWDFYQLDIASSGTNAADIKLKLLKARDDYLQYFGVNPVALTVPTDNWDESGYMSIQEAGYKIFSTHTSEEPCPSIDPVDSHCHKDSAGMYRIPTASDVCVWDETKLKWTDVIDISKPAGITGYCKYYTAYEDLVENEIANMTCYLLSYIGVAAISIHPDAFVGADGKVDKAKLEQIQPIIDWMKTLGTITTFEQWYNYRTRNQ